MIGWKSVTKQHPCVICGGPDNCTISADGRFLYCGRISEGSTGKQNNGGQFLHAFDADGSKSGAAGAIDWLQANPRPASVVNAKPVETATKDFTHIARKAFDHPDAGISRAKLAKLLGVTVESTERIGVGYLGYRNGWSMPERDQTGRIIGINRRMPNGDKRRMKDGKAGLTFDPVRLFDCSDYWTDTIHLVEGASDVLAMLSMNLLAIGRPSNLGGVDLLAKLLKGIPPERRIAVIGERDRRPHKSLSAARQARHKPECPGCSVCWPGMSGAIQTAQQLVNLLHRPISWTLAPEGSKDVREWLNKSNEIKVN